uniref:Tight junction protein 3 n=1 Tax=Bubo bubo TaxID=30461 RepID=A0A8C0EZ16_BUBBB
SGGRDRPNRITGDTAVVVSDVVAGGPAVGRLQRKDHIVMVNGLSMDNVLSSFAIQTLKTCGKIANITLKRPKKVHLPASKSSPGSPTVPRHCDSDEDYGLRGVDPALHHSRDDLDHSQGYDGDSSSERSSGHHQDDRRHPKPVSRSRRRSQDSSHWRQGPGSGDTNGLVLVSGFKRLPCRDVPMKPITSVLVKQKQNEEYGLKLGSQLFIKHIVESGLAAKGSSLQEGDLILKINGVASEDMSLADTQQLIERTEGTLTLLILRDHRQFLVNIPDVEDSQSDSSRMDDISDIESEPSHPPSPETSLQPPAAARMNSQPAEQIASLESVLKATSGANPSGARAEFWKLRGLRGAKKMLRKSREDLCVLTKQGRYPPYETVVLKEANFKRPVVILGPIADVAMQKLSTELPELFEIAPSVPRDGASSKVIKLDSVRQIAEKDKHALLDITPSAVERLNYVQYYPVVVFCEPESRQGIKAMRQWLAPDSRKTSRWVPPYWYEEGLGKGLPGSQCQLCLARPCLAGDCPCHPSRPGGRGSTAASRPPREYEHEAVRKRFTRARDDSDQDEGYEWGPATDV